MKVLSAALSLVAALAAPFAGGGLAFWASALAPVLSGGYALSALLVVARQSAPAPSATIAIRDIIRFFFIGVCSLGSRHLASEIVNSVRFARVHCDNLFRRLLELFHRQVEHAEFAITNAEQIHCFQPRIWILPRPLQFRHCLA